MTVREQNGQAVFGPVPSRRLGMSLGVDLILPKTCSLDCIYCEAGPTTLHTSKRDRFRDPEELLTQVKQRLAELEKPPDYITLAGSGEPSLNLDMGYVLTELKKLSPAKLAILTNGTLATDPEVRKEMCLADTLIPSLDAVSPEVFRRVNRPVKGLDIKEIIEGVAQLSREFKGELILEILLVEGVNDHAEEIKGLVEAAAYINPSKVQLNTVVRPPALESAGPLSDQRMQEIAALFTVPTEVCSLPANQSGKDSGNLAEEIVEMTKRRPCTLEDIVGMTGLERPRVQEMLARLKLEEKVLVEQFGDKAFYRGV